MSSAVPVDRADTWIERGKDERRDSTGGTSTASPYGDQKDGAKSTAYDQTTYMNLRHKYNRRTIQDQGRPKREAARSMCRPLKQWLYAHRDLPYPTRADKVQLAGVARMSVVQVSNWFANARRRLKKTGQPAAAAASSSPSGATAVLSWEQRFKLYNRNVVGNQERLSISSDESEEMDDFNSDDDEAVSACSAKPYSTSSGNFSGEEKDFPAARSSSGDGERAVGLLLPGKFKQGILHRYLSDSYRMSFVRSSTDIGGGGGGGDVDRVRKMSGSPTSRDSAVSTSCRSTPTRDHQNEESFETVDVYSNEHVQSQGESADYELQSLELSAVHVLVSLAASNRNSQRNS